MIDTGNHLFVKLELKLILNQRKEMIIHQEDGILLDIQDPHLLHHHLVIQVHHQAYQGEAEITIIVDTDPKINIINIDISKINIALITRNQRTIQKTMNIMTFEITKPKINTNTKILQYPLSLI